jgi:hypothetical protein
MAKRLKKRAETTDAAGDFKITIEPFGPTQDELDRLATQWLESKSFQQMVGRSRHRLLSVVLVEDEATAKATRIPPPSDRVRATVYDYGNNRTIFIDGSLNAPKKIEIVESSFQPQPSAEEFREAVALLEKHKELGASLREGELRAYAPMPPLVQIETPSGEIERTVAVGLLPAKGRQGHEIVGVNLVRRTVERFDGGAPAGSMANSQSICGAPVDANQPTARHVAGQVRITVKQGGTTLWRFLAVRPAASSGTNGSAIELRYVDYRGKRLLYRAHVPILNVKYDGNACGPYRDWQNQEGQIQAVGADVAPGFRLCTSPATTILDTGSDTGNYLGVGIYVQGQEVVLVSEMEAGWYRYVSSWRLHTDGSIKPRFGFAAVDNSCVCNRHHHHVYWRLDFDLRTAGNNAIREFNDPPLVGSSNWHDKTFEIRRPRDPGRKRKWRVLNTASGEAYDIIPGPSDGVATAMPDWPFPRGDVWLVRWHPGELDDGSVAIGPPYEAGLDGFLNGESMKGRDVVVWYGAHFTHDLSHDHAATHGHIVGPKLKRVKW